MAGTYTVVASCVADPTRTATCTVTVRSANGVSVTLTPEEAILAPGGVMSFQAEPYGADYSNLVFACSGGSIQPQESGAFTWTAPATAGDYTVSATVSGTNAKAMALMHVRTTPTGVSVLVCPSGAWVTSGGSQTFSASVTGNSNTAVTWSCSGGMIQADGSWVAPDLAGTYTVTATSDAEPSKSSSALVIVPMTISLTSPGAMDQGASCQLIADVQGAANTNVNWASTGGSIDANGNFTAPFQSGTITVTGTCQADSSLSAAVQIPVNAVAISLDPTAVSQPAGTLCYFSASVSGSVDQAVVWSVVSGGGSFMEPGIYIAPFTVGTSVIRAASHSDPTKYVQATIATTANSDPVIYSFSASPVRIEPGGSASLMANFWNGTGVVQPGDTPITSGTPLTVSPLGTTSYSLAVTSSASTATAEALVQVAGSGTFTAGPVLHGTTGYPTPILDRDGKVTIVMGVESGSPSRGSAERFDPATNLSVSLGAVFPTIRQRYSSALMADGKIMIHGGTYKLNNNTIWARDSFLLDPSTGQVSVGPTGGSCMDSTLTLLGDGSLLFSGGLVFDGTDHGTPSNSLLRWGSQGWFSSMPSMAQPRSGHRALLLMDGRVLLAGGTDPALLEVYDPTANTCTVVGSGPLGAIPILRPDGKVLLLSVLDESAAILDPSTNTTTSLPNPGTGLLLGALPANLPTGNILLGGATCLAPLLDLPSMSLRTPVSQVTDEYYDNGSPLTLLPDGRAFQVAGWGHGYSVLFDTGATFKIIPANAMTNQGIPIALHAVGATGMVSWAVSSGGAVTSDGVFTAAQSGIYVITGTDAGSGATATTWIRVLPPIGIKVSLGALPPGTSWLRPGDTVQLIAQITNAPSQGVTWAMAPGTVGATLTPDGLFTATATGTFTVLVAPALHAALQQAIQIKVFPANLAAPSLTAVTCTPYSVSGNNPVTLNLSWNADFYTGFRVRFPGEDGQTHVSEDMAGPSRFSFTFTPANMAPGLYSCQLEVWNPAGMTTQQVGFRVLESNVSLSIQPTAISLMAGMSEQFGYELTAPTNRLVWSASGGAITETGYYTAPAMPGSYVVFLQSVDDPDVISTCQVTVIDELLTLNPESVTLEPGQSIQYGIQFAGPSPTTFQWSATGGSITQGGYYTAPASPGTYNVMVSPSSQPTLVRTSIVTVPATPFVQVLPSFASVAPGGMVSFAAVVRSGNVTWSVQEAGGGTITQTGLYTAPLVVGTYTVVATSSLNGLISSGAQVVVRSGGDNTSSGTSTGTGTSGAQITISPCNINATAGEYLPLNANVTGNSDTGVVWSIQGSSNDASIDSNGIFVARRRGSYILTASSHADSTAYATCNINVISSIKQLPDFISGFYNGYTITGLKDGRILIAGGSTDTTGVEQDDWGTFNYSSVAQAQIYDPSTGQFSNTGSMITPRYFHHAVLLDDGRVLIAGGSARWHDPWSYHIYDPPEGPGTTYTTWNEFYPGAEVFDPTTGTFQDLPLGTLVAPDIVHSSLPTSTHTLPGHMVCDHTVFGSDLKMSNGEVIIFGGDLNAWWWNTVGNAGSFRTTVDKFTPGPGRDNFDLGEWVYWPGWRDLSFSNNIYMGLGIGPRAINLADGNIIWTVGAMNDLGWGFGNWPATVDTIRAHITSPDRETWFLSLPMVVPRFGHTLTLLPDGRVLAAGGKDMRQARVFEERNYYNSTNTAEIYDPATNTWTATGNLNFSRAFHAAQLLPSGKVLIVGGYQCDVNGNYAYPNTTELFDPISGQFSVMDNLDYGISSPQLALMNDGSVFVAGQIEPPMNPPSQSQAQSQCDSAQGFKIRPMSDVGATMLAGDYVSGVIKTAMPSITITWHYIKYGSISVSLHKHTAIRIIPSNQSKWRADPIWGGQFILDPATNLYYIVLSAYPNPEGGVATGTAMLTKQVDRPSDIGTQNGYMATTISINSGNEDAVLNMIFNAFKNYTNNINYTLIPSGPPGTTEYNSNSFTHGLINAIGLGACVSSIDWSYAGWNNPLPASCFGY